MQTVYSAGSQGTKVRLVMWGSLILLSVCAWQAIETFQTYGLRAAEGGRLAPLAARAAWAITWSALGLAGPIGMWVYGRRYIAAIRMDEASSAVEFDTLGWFGTRKLQFPASAVSLGRFHAGAFSGRVSVKAPWTAVRVDGLRGRLILDAQGRLIDESFPARVRAARRTPSRR